MSAWPALPYPAWKDSCATLQLWTQIIGKIRLAQTPWVNHSWHVPLYVTATGLTTSPIPYGDRSFQIDFDFVDHVLWLKASDGHSRQIVLRPMPVAEFHGLVFEELGQLGLSVTIDNIPNEIADAIPFTEDSVHDAYDATRRTASGVSCCRAITSFRTFAPAFSARSRRCISSGAASILR